MKQAALLLFSIGIFVSACASATSAPTEQVGVASATQPVEAQPASATATPEPSPTPVPPPAHWYWTVAADTARVMAVNQFGEKHELGQLDQADDLFTSSISLDEERALLFLDADNNLRIYLLTPDGMQKIALPSDPYYFNNDLSQSSRALIAVHGDKAVFSYVTQGGSNVAPDSGPVFLVDLSSLTAKLVDQDVSRGPYGDNRHWFHASEDGRFLRYLNGDRDKMEIRELDLVSGDVRTIFTTRGSGFSIQASPQGDLWYAREPGIILDLNSQQTNFSDDSLAYRLLENGKGLVFPRNCPDQCEINVVTPFGNDAELEYTLPWGIQSGAFTETVSQLLPDQSLLFVGSDYLNFSTPPEAAQDYPDLTDEDQPLFRLTPDGQGRLVGIYKGAVSTDGRSMLLKSSDKTSFFLYDAITDSPLFSMPAIATLDYFYTTTSFFDSGILVNLTASVPGGDNIYRNFYYAYSYETSAAVDWKDVKLEFNGCLDLLEDGSIVCWFYRTDTSSSDLVRYDPASGTKTTLMENVWPIDSTVP